MSTRTISKRALVAAALRRSGIPWLIRRLVARSRVTVVAYHDPTPEVLDEHLAYMAKHYQFITLDDLAVALHSADWSGIPPYSLVVTLDDGHVGNGQLGDTFERHGVRPTIYICTQIVATHRRFWFTEAGAGPKTEYKGLPNADRLCALAERVGFEQTQEHTDSAPHALTLENLRAMRRWADLESHSRFHPILTMCSDEECEEEIQVSRDEVVKLVDAPCNHFCFPNGDWGERELELLRKAGYRTGRSTDYGWNGPGANPFRLRAMGLNDDASVDLLAVQLSGMIGYLRNFRHGRFRGETPRSAAIDLNAR